MLSAIEAEDTPEVKTAAYALLAEDMVSILEDEPDWVAAMATAACELHHRFRYFHWTGFYRAAADDVLIIGPYQGGHGCLRIPFSRGVCGASARAKETVLVEDVQAFQGHIACSATTRSEIVVPVLSSDGRLIAVLDVDSDLPAVFDAVDQRGLEVIAAFLGQRYGTGEAT
jgi:L-methionine (R)-S-oxide reductase